MRKIFESPLPQVDGASRLSDCLQVWELSMRCWTVDPAQRPTAKMCKTTVTYLPRCTPTLANADPMIRSAALLENLGDLESWKGNLEKSSAYLDEAMQLYQEEADTKGIASVLLKRAVAAFRISDYGKVRAIAATALEHYRTLNDTLGIAAASYYLGHSALMMDETEEVDKVLALLQESLKIRRMHSDDVGTVECLETIGQIQTAKGEFQEALSTLAEAVEIASRSGDRLGLANVLNLAGVTHCALSDFDKATDALSEAITINRNVGWEAEVSTNLTHMGVVKLSLGDSRAAEELFQESVSIARQTRDRWRLAQGLEVLGLCFWNQSKLDEAAPPLEEAFLLWQELSKPSETKEIANILAQLRSLQRQWDSALSWHDHVIAVSRGQNRYEEVAQYLIQKGDVLVKARRFDEAALHIEAAIATCRDNGYSWPEERAQLFAIPKTAMKWEGRVPLLYDIRKLQRRLPHLVTASLKLPILISHESP
ncbi:hypothetical protein M407DRAFT_244734 [Tulasnella calospora MUT 4182]|uniref:Tetratricopeptide repeat protein 29 n=1 Tax=Tulasnella calospora MUT 4182 TaxID=1051891 RepID=A0A0C3Q3Y9_9AGAM|nr:hypothetical protein M407DRAFT_244734 [Tulasnella calospora MUT 4182]